MTNCPVCLGWRGYGSFSAKTRMFWANWEEVAFLRVGPAEGGMMAPGSGSDFAPLGDIWQSLETSLVANLGWAMLVSCSRRGWGCCRTFHKAQSSPHHKELIRAKQAEIP